jgi:hypothetical protein
MRRQTVGWLSYSNVMATIAVFVAIGGASFAAVTLPAGSVGRAQLTTGALSFPLSVTRLTTNAPKELMRGGGCGRGASCFVRLGEGAPLGHVYLRAAGKLVVFTTVMLEDQGPTGSTAIVRIGLFADRRQLDERVLEEVHGGQRLEIELEGTTGGRAGANTVGVSATAAYNYSASGNVVVGSVTGIVLALPS